MVYVLTIFIKYTLLTEFDSFIINRFSDGIFY